MHYNFIEIGTSDFNTLIQSCDDDAVGISIEPVLHYFNKLPKKPNVTKINVAISIDNSADDALVYYIPESVILSNGLQDWFKGCNKIGAYHPLHIAHNVQHLVEKLPVKQMTASQLYEQYDISGVDYLKIDTEGADCFILMHLFEYLNNKDWSLWPNRILFESNSNSSRDMVNKVVEMYQHKGYKIQTLAEDTIMEK